MLGFSARKGKANPLPVCYPEILADYSFLSRREYEIFSGKGVGESKSFQYLLKDRNILQSMNGIKMLLLILLGSYLLLTGWLLFFQNGSIDRQTYYQDKERVANL